ncbi:MAG: WD40/YVTN/BNR-like repeat-containing protein [Bdellovibrionales bacterium]
MNWGLLIASVMLITSCSAPTSLRHSFSSTGSIDPGEPTNPAGPIGPDPSPGPALDPGAPSEPVRLSPTPGKWVNVTSNLVGMTSECGNTPYVSAKPNEDLVIASVALQGLWGTKDGGSTWSRLGTNLGSATITNRGGNIVYDPMAIGRFWQAGIYNGNGVYRTDDSGKSYVALGAVSHTDSVSVDLVDPNRMTLLAGAHEQKQKVYRSQDGGLTWINVGANLPADSAFSSFPHVVDSKTFFAGCSPSWGGGVGGIFQSDDSGGTWHQISAKGGGNLPLVAHDGSIYWSSDDGSLVRGVGQGMNWTFTQTVGPGTLRNVQPVELPDGRIVSLGAQNIMISSDQGVTWKAFGPPLPFQPVGITYSKYDQSFYIWQFDCGDRVLPNAIMKLWM